MIYFFYLQVNGSQPYFVTFMQLGVVKAKLNGSAKLSKHFQCVCFFAIFSSISHLSYNEMALIP